MDLNGLPDDAFSPGLDLGGLPDDNAKALREQYRATTAAPDQAAKDFDLARRSGLPKPVVERNRQEAERKAFEPDWTDLETRAPITVREMAVNAKLFELAHDDTDNLAEIERTLNRRSDGKVGGPAFVRGPDRVAPSISPEPSFSSIAYGLGQSFVQGAERARQGARLQFADALGFDEMAADALRKRDQSQSRQDLTTPAFDTATGRGLYSGGVSTLQNLPGIIASIFAGNPVPALAAAGGQVELDAYGKYRSRGASGGMALLGAAGEGAVEVATELIPLRTMLGAFGQPGKTAAKEFLKSQVQEQFGEQVATILQDAIDTAVANPDKTWGQYLAERPGAAYETALATLVQSGVMAAGHTAVARFAPQEAQAGAAARDAEAVAQIAQLAAASKLRARDPHTFEQFVAAANEDGPVQDIYLDARTLQQAGIDLAALAQSSPTVAQQAAEALATGGDLVIPVSEYASRIAGTDLDAVLTPHLRTSADAMSLNEAETFYQSQAAEFQRVVRQIAEEKATDDAWQASAKAVEAKLFEELRGTKRFTDDVNTAYATLLRDFYVTTASRLGITPEEMFARYPLKVAAERAVADARMEQPTNLTAEEINAFAEGVKARHGVQELDLRLLPNGAIRLDTIAVAKTGTGAGSRAMQDVIDYADRTGRRLVLTLAEKGYQPIEGGPKTSSPSRLRDFYKSFGFVENKGRNKDYRISDGMIREPQKPLAQSANPLQRLAQSVMRALGVSKPQEQAAPAGPTLDVGEFFGQPRQEGSRGEISFGKDITSTPSVITLFQNADLSTLLHEMGHFQLEVLANIASRPDAPAEIVQDMDAVLKWFGVADLATWRGMSLEERRPHHEQFARGFEAYLFEGKAPSQELTGLFARFRAWLLAVYKSIKALNVDISPEVRGVFDRMLATDEAIQQAQAARGMAPLFSTAKQMGDPVLWSEYQREAQQATQDATDELQKRGLRDMRWLDNARARLLKQMQKDAKAKRQAVEDEVRAEVEAMPVYAAQDFLNRPDNVDPAVTAAQQEWKKQREERRAFLAEQVKAEVLARPEAADLKGLYKGQYLARNRKAMALEVDRRMLEWDSANPRPQRDPGNIDEIAGWFGFTSADHLKHEIKAAGPKDVMIEGMTDQRMLERYGDLSSPDTLARAVDEAIHNEARARFVATELKALTKAAGPARVMANAAKAFAEATLARKKVREIKPAQYAKAETRAAKAAEKAMAAGDTVLAATEKRNQLVQNYSTRLSYDALDEIDRAVKYLRKFDTEGTRKNLDADYLDQIDALLERFDLRASVSNKDAAKRKSLMAWVESQREQGFEPDIPPELLTEAQRQPYRELTLEELRGLVDTVKQIEHLGRLKHKLLTAQDQRAFEAARDDIVNSIRDNAKKSLPEQRASDRGFLVKMGSLFRYATAIHRKFSSLARGFDGFKDGGPAWEYLVRNMNARGDFEAVEIEKATMALTKLLMPVTDKANGKMTQKEYFPTTGKSFTREERISFLLNMGNETNLERLLTGERLSPTQLQQVVGTLTKADAEFANRVWEYLDTFRPLIAEKERRVTGKEPEWVEAQPFTLTLASGETVAMRGGYYPIAYDPLRSERSNADVNAEVARQVQQGLYARAQTRRGHTKARTESTGRPLRYDFGEVISNHVTQVIHDLAWHEYLIDANRLLRSQAIEQVVREHYGVEVLQEMKDTLRDIAVGSMGAEKGATFWNHLRYGTTIAGLGLNVFNTLQNLTGITQSMSRVGTGWVLKGAAHWAGDAASFESSIAKVHAKSDFMRLRAKTMQREINDIRNKVSGKDSRLMAAYFYLQAKTQMIVDIPTWWGAYEKAMATDDMTEKTAVALADQAVLDAQGSGQTKDLAGIQRGGAGMKLFTTFYSFFNTTFNLTAEAYARTDFAKPKDVALFAADVALLYSIPALLTTLLKAALMGDWDDEKKLAKKIIGDQISFAMGTVVGLREMSAAAQAATGTGEGFGYTGPASVRFFSDLYNLGKQVQQGEADEAFWKSLDNVGGVLFHYPSGQLNRTATGIAALSDGHTSNPMAIVMGAPPKK